jgi:hypothetical protein
MRELMPSFVKTLDSAASAASIAIPSRSAARQAQRGQTDQKVIWRAPGTEAERHAERIALGRRQTLQAIQQRRAQLLQPRERKLHLGLHARATRHPTPRRPLDHVLQQRRLAYPRLPTHHQHATLTPANRLQQPIQNLALGVAVLQHLATPPRGRRFVPLDRGSTRGDLSLPEGA